jgi:hypothetical protein
VALSKARDVQNKAHIGQYQAPFPCLELAFGAPKLAVSDSLLLPGQLPD